jgi:hypothetical protein
MGTIRVLREAAAHVELTLRLSLQAIGKIRKLLEAIYEIASCKIHTPLNTVVSAVPYRSFKRVTPTMH